MNEADDDTSLRAWLRRWGACVASVDFDEAVKLFDPSVVGFGTRAEVAVGLEQLVEQQWRHVWPSISGFEFDVDNVHMLVGSDRTQAVIVTT